MKTEFDDMLQMLLHVANTEIANYFSAETL